MDTVAKRFSAINVGAPWRGCAIVPSGSVDGGERQATAFLYSGIIAQAQAPVVETFFYGDDAFEEKPRKSRRREREEVLEDVLAAIESKQPKGFFKSAKAARAERVAVSLEGTSTSDVAAALAFAKSEPSEDAKAIKAIQSALAVELRRREIEEDDAEVELLLRALN